MSKEKPKNKKRSNYTPETNDKVFVKFEQGDMKKPIVTGSVWNKSDKPPDINSSKKTSKKIIKKFKITKTKPVKKSTNKTKTNKISKNKN
ncbi:MAG: phage baseplate assembly protein V [Nitrosopumilus sp.]|nr:phage baseplate assembly protein V [Nitrosopumilus sp.]MDH3735423.1 phage baseplate assembly protein V [Nitrosopumilus sp.]MDH3823268.1 phage baseplate assembly protein V [Nitrosopumilus sp.]MDH3832543.1 phage baseplate assembly protein V [Nitrosopumilus sp.]